MSGCLPKQTENYRGKAENEAILDEEAEASLNQN